MKHEMFINEKGEKCYRITTESSDEDELVNRLVKNKVVTIEDKPADNKK